MMGAAKGFILNADIRNIIRGVARTMAKIINKFRNLSLKLLTTLAPLVVINYNCLYKPAYNVLTYSLNSIQKFYLKTLKKTSFI
jgi:hypothetical protein